MHKVTLTQDTRAMTELEGWGRGRYPLPHQLLLFTVSATQETRELWAMDQEGHSGQTDRISRTAGHPRSNLNLWASTNMYVSLCLSFLTCTSFLVDRVPVRKKPWKRCLSSQARAARRQHQCYINSKVAGKMAMPLYGDHQQAKCILGKYKKTIYSLRRSQWLLPETWLLCLWRLRQPRIKCLCSVKWQKLKWKWTPSPGTLGWEGWAQSPPPPPPANPAHHCQQ